MKRITGLVLGSLLTLGCLTVEAQTGGQRGQRGGNAAPNVNNTQRLDIDTFARPIDMHDTVWMEDLTMLEIRDLLKAGKTTALILTGGVEENGPYLTTGKHNNVLRVMGNAVARKLGNALCAPIVTLEPGNPIPQNGRRGEPGTILLSQETYTAVLTDMANSLKSQGFQNIIFLGDSGGNSRGMISAAKNFNDRWKGDGAWAYHIAEYYNYTGPNSVQEFEENVLGVKEKIGLENGGDGFHDDYYISAFIMLHDLNGVRMPERIKAKKTSINGIDLAPGGKVEKTLENARKMVEFRADVTVKAIQKAVAEKKIATSNQ